MGLQRIISKNTPNYEHLIQNSVLSFNVSNENRYNEILKLTKCTELLKFLLGF